MRAVYEMHPTSLAVDWPACVPTMLPDQRKFSVGIEREGQGSTCLIGDIMIGSALERNHAVVHVSAGEDAIRVVQVQVAKRPQILCGSQSACMSCSTPSYRMTLRLTIVSGRDVPPGGNRNMRGEPMRASTRPKFAILRPFREQLSIVRRLND